MALVLEAINQCCHDMQEESNPWALPAAPASAPVQPAQPVPMAATPTKLASAPAKAQTPGAFSPSKEPDAPQLLQRLKDDILKKGECPSEMQSGTCCRFVQPLLCKGPLNCKPFAESCPQGMHAPRTYGSGSTLIVVEWSAGGKWDDRWRVESKMRTSGNTAGTWDSVKALGALLAKSAVFHMIFTTEPRLHGHESSKSVSSSCLAFVFEAVII